jgi:hypothetical protein
MRATAPTPRVVLPRAGSRRANIRIVAQGDNRNALARVAGSAATSDGLALSGAIMALNGGLAKFTVREDVAVSRTEEAGKTTVTIKVCRTALLDQPRALPKAEAVAWLPVLPGFAGTSRLSRQYHVTRVRARDSCWGPLRESARRAAPWQLTALILARQRPAGPVPGLTHARTHWDARHTLRVSDSPQSLFATAYSLVSFRRLSEL